VIRGGELWLRPTTIRRSVISNTYVLPPALNRNNPDLGRRMFSSTMFLMMVMSAGLRCDGGNQGDVNGSANVEWDSTTMD
jgi:hypothetical protein